MPEVWQPIPGHDGYEASSEGRIRKHGKIVRQVQRGRYLYAGKRRAHPLIATAFHGERPEGLCCCHRDDDALNNSASNLYWGTYSQNTEDARVNGRMSKGSEHPISRLTEDQVQEIRARHAAGERQVDLAAAFGMSQPMISKIIRRASWKHV